MTAHAVHDCVGALVVRSGAVLLGRRASDREFLPGAWDTFGGHIDPGEREEDTLRRELVEELGIEPTQWQRLETIRGQTPAPWQLHLYAVTAWRGVPYNRQPSEHAVLRWCDLSEAVGHLGPAHPDFGRLLAQAIAMAGR